MTPFYWESSTGNFGDDLNLWLWDFLLPGHRQAAPETMLVGVGTVLNEDLLPAGVRKLVVGSGAGYGRPPRLSTAAEWDIRAVRGPLTAELLGLDPKVGIIDPAVMVTDMPEFQGLAKRHKTIFVPHWESVVSGMWDTVAAMAGLTFVNPCDDAKSVIAAIATAELVVAESMHAAILADAFRVPWIAVSTSSKVNRFKWRDWAQSVGAGYDPILLPVSTRTEAMEKGERFLMRRFERPVPAPKGHGEPAEITTPRPTTPRAGIRYWTKAALALPAVIALARASRARGQLSPEGRVLERKGAFANVLDGVRRDYGLPRPT